MNITTEFIIFNYNFCQSRPAVAAAAELKLTVFLSAAVISEWYRTIQSTFRTTVVLGPTRCSGGRLKVTYRCPNPL